MDHIVSRRRYTVEEERQRLARRRRAEREDEHELWRVTAHLGEDQTERDTERQAEARAMTLPEENLLYFLEKQSLVLRDWQRELLRIVRNLSTYFEPQRQTKMMNEGCASWCHYSILHRLREKGLNSS